MMRRYLYFIFFAIASSCQVWGQVPSGIQFGWRENGPNNFTFIVQGSPRNINEMATEGLELAVSIPENLQGSITEFIWRIGEGPVERIPSQAELESRPRQNRSDSRSTAGISNPIDRGSGGIVPIDPQRSGSTIPTNNTNNSGSPLNSLAQATPPSFSGSSFNDLSPASSSNTTSTQNGGSPVMPRSNDPLPSSNPSNNRFNDITSPSGTTFDSPRSGFDAPRTTDNLPPTLPPGVVGQGFSVSGINPATNNSQPLSQRRDTNNAPTFANPGPSSSSSPTGMSSSGYSDIPTNNLRDSDPNNFPPNRERPPQNSWDNPIANSAGWGNGMASGNFGSPSNPSQNFRGNDANSLNGTRSQGTQNFTDSRDDRNWNNPQRTTSSGRDFSSQYDDDLDDDNYRRPPNRSRNFQSDITSSLSSRSFERLAANPPLNELRGNSNESAFANRTGVSTTDSQTSETRTTSNTKSMERVISLLFIVSLVANVYLIGLLNRLLTRYRTLQASHRSNRSLVAR